MSAYRRIAGAVRITEWLVVGTFVQECFNSRFKNRCRDIEIIAHTHTRACVYQRQLPHLQYCPTSALFV